MSASLHLKNDFFWGPVCYSDKMAEFAREVVYMLRVQINQFYQLPINVGRF
jgi:hypothetical protein